MSLTEFAIKRDRVTAVVILVLIRAGIMTYLRMPRQTDPGFIIRTAQVVTFFPGASPERVEQLVSDKIEEVVQEIPELDFVVSDSETGLSVVTVQIKDAYRNMRPIWDNLRRKVERIRPSLPAGIVGPTVNDEFGDVFGIMPLAVRAATSPTPSSKRRRTRFATPCCESTTSPRSRSWAPKRSASSSSTATLAWLNWD